MKTLEQINAIMQTIPPQGRFRWCGGELFPCACMGCVQIYNRVIMWEEANGRKFLGDPEYIRESEIPPEIYSKYKITKDEWEFWKSQEAK